MSEVCRGIGVLHGAEIVEDEGAVLGVNVRHPISCGVVILCRKGWQRGSSQITLGVLVKCDGLLKATGSDVHKKSDDITETVPL